MGLTLSNNQSIKKGSRYSTVPFLFLILLLLSALPLSSFGSNTPEDSTKAFPINDPRNPNCPCHKYQKLADEEYKKLIGEQKKIVVQDKVEIKKENTVTASNGNASGKHYSAHKYKRKKITKRNTKFRRMLTVSDWKIWKRWKDPTMCFSWK